MLKKNLFFPILIIFCIIFIILWFKISTESIKYYKVKEVIDGDTIVLENGHQVRYLGIDAPEIKHGEVKEECGGKEATEANMSFLLDGKVRLISDQPDKDHYGRLLRYVYTDKGEFINYVLVRQGYAQAFDQPPLGKLNNLLFQAQRDAKADRLGIWKKCFINLSGIKEDKLITKCITANEAWKRIGEYGCVEYTVNNISREENRNIWLNEKGNFITGFSATIFPRGATKFFESLLLNYNGKTIQVIGNIRMYRGRPVMIINNPLQIKISN